MDGRSPTQYIHLVQHLIEECIIYNLSKEECMEALSKHANIQPLITSTVWKELEKENMEFFEAYYSKKKKERESSCGVLEEKTRQRIIQEMLSLDTSPKVPNSNVNNNND